MRRCKMCTYLYDPSRCCCESCLCNAEVTQEGLFFRFVCLVFPSLFGEDHVAFESLQFFFQVFQHVPKTCV